MAVSLLWMKKKTKTLRFVIVDDRIVLSLLRDLGTMVTAVAIIFFANYFEVKTFEWVGALIFVLCLAGVGKQSNYTINQARQELDRLEGEDRDNG